MKVACIGNMNNILFQAGRYLIDENHDVTFFLLDEFDHFMPVADTFKNVSNYKIVHLGWNHSHYLALSKKEIINKLKDFKFYIGTDLAPAFLFKAGMKLDIFFPHGSDLYDYPFPTYKNTPPQLWEIIPYLCGKAQFLGIKETSVISLDSSEDVYEKPLDKIKKKPYQRILAPPFLYLKQYSQGFQKLSEKYDYFLKIRDSYKFIAFQHGSQDWSDRGPFKINKGNDVLIYAFADYLKQENNSDDSVLILLEYGMDIPKSKRLIADLNIDKNVIWLPKMFRKDLMVIISMSDICIGELGYRNWFSYGCVYEFMAMKKPLIHHRNDKHYEKLGVELYPMVDAKDIITVKNTFLNYRINPNKYIQMGEEAYEWINKRSVKCMAEYINIINQKADNKLPGNYIKSAILKKCVLYMKLDMIYSVFFMYYHKIKLILKSKWVTQN